MFLYLIKTWLSFTSNFLDQNNSKSKKSARMSWSSYVSAFETTQNVLLGSKTLGFIEFLNLIIHSCSFLKQYIKHKTRMFSQLLHSHKMHLFAIFVLFMTKVTDFPILSYTLTSGIPTLSYTWGTPFGWSLPIIIGYYRELPPPLPSPPGFGRSQQQAAIETTIFMMDTII